MSLIIPRIAVRLQLTTCPGDHLHVLVTLNGIDQNYVLLGDANCTPVWSNETHAQFSTHVDNCSLVLNNFHQKRKEMMSKYHYP